MVRPTDPGSRCPHLMDPGSGHPIQGQIQDGVPDVVLRMTTLGVTSHLRSAIVHCVISIALPAGLRGPTGTPTRTPVEAPVGVRTWNQVLVWVSDGSPGGVPFQDGVPQIHRIRGDHIRGPRITDPEDPPTAKQSNEWREAPHNQAPTGPWCRCMHNVQCNLGHRHAGRLRIGPCLRSMGSGYPGSMRSMRSCDHQIHRP